MPRGVGVCIIRGSGTLQQVDLNPSTPLQMLNRMQVALITSRAVIRRERSQPACLHQDPQIPRLRRSRLAINRIQYTALDQLQLETANLTLAI